MEEQKSLGNGMFSIYSCEEKRFNCSPALREAFCPAAGERPASLECVFSPEEWARLRTILENMSALDQPEVYYAPFRIKDSSGGTVEYEVGFICDEPKKQIVLTFLRSPAAPPQEGKDKVGLMNRAAFLDRLETVLRETKGSGGAVVFFDVQRFKVINTMFGMVEGDRLLLHISEKLQEVVGTRGFAGHLNADRFVFYLRGGREEAEECVEALFDEVATFGLPFEILCNAGIHILEQPGLAADAAVDGAIMAQKRIKGSFSQRFNYFNEDMRKSLLGEQEVTGMMRTALKKGQFAVYYQPQYNHTTGMLVGAEALVRWLHPEKGTIPPGQFIPVFEKNGFISQLDKHVFTSVCQFLRRQMDEGVSLVPVSVNLTRYDLYTPGYLESLEELRQRYGVPPRYIRIELTESSALGSSNFINEALQTLHQYGYTVEMDDFGSGYSSLNILKDLDFDIIKLDMRFFEEEAGQRGRGGTILSSVVRMVNWLQLPMIAEGVETGEQADFLRSIGCDYIQGYLYAKPMPEEDFAQLLKQSRTESASPHMQLIETMDAERFWSSESLETLIFSNYVGGAAIFDYNGERAEVLRVNKKYLQELGMNLSEKDVVNKNLLGFLDGAGLKTYRAMLERAIETGEEQECETWRSITSSCCGEDRICIRATVRTVGSSKCSHIFYAMIRNITAEKKRYAGILDSERRFMAASEQANIYFWEYTVATREMRPCFRCMRDLGLPALLQNYPDSAIELGVFPPEVADMYRDWHRQIAEGVPYLEAVIPLTVGRVPFHVRYTTEFDESGHPVKAYGSATLVVDH